jgi:hypothetical protein
MNPQGLLLYVEGEASFCTISILLKLSVRDQTVLFEINDWKLIGRISDFSKNKEGIMHIGDFC